jgi:energy-coupling factor transporter ATP-binding protein EcfA2
MRGDGRFDVFLSYARSDGWAAAELNRWLSTQGFRTFFDRSELRPGLRWIAGLEDAIGRSNAVAILVGRHGIGNTQQYERELALVRQTRDSGFPVIPVLMPGCETPPPGFLQILTWIDLTQGDSVLGQTESLEALRGAIHRQAIPSSSVRTEICPYRGLEPFREEDAALFCGRDDAIRNLVSQVQKYRFVVVVGPSGSGKSSLVFAGLLPALRQQGEITMWDVVPFRPGTSPLRTLAAVFGSVPESAGPAETDSYLEKEAAEYRAGDPGKLARIVNDRLDTAREKPDRLLIYVDQWEELYAMAPTTEDAEQRCQHASDADKFIALLIAASSYEQSRATVVLTVRADFYNPLIRHSVLSTLLPQQQVNIPPMSPDGLRSAIETPAKKAGLSFVPPVLVDQILNDVGMEEGRLPLLQFALKETWERRESDRLTAEAYMEVGGVAGAIQKTAERAYAALTPAQKEAARRLFLRLVTPGEGQEDTRARSPIPDDPEQRDIINLFSNPRTRLLVTGYDALEGALAQRNLRATVEIAHETLIRRWPTLRAWVDANREKLRARAAILRAKAEWEEKGNVDKFLLDPGIQLERGRSLLDSPGDVPVDDIRDYVDRSIKKEGRRLDAERKAALADQKRITEAERQAKEAAEDAARQSEAARAAAEVARRQLRNRLIQIASVAVIALVALSASVYLGYLASQRALESQRQLDRANKALAAGILADLNFQPREQSILNSHPGLAFTGRQRNALWKLTTADEAVRAEFISVLSASPEDMIRIAAGFGEVSRSWGLQRPSWADANKLLTTAIDAIGQTSNPVALQGLAGEFDLLAAKLTDAQAQQAIELLLQQIRKTTNPDALRALAEGLKALGPKLTAQAEQVIALLLQQIGKTTDSDALLALAKGLKALASKLTGAQARQVIARLLQQIGKTTNPDALQALAEGLTALPVKPTAAQAEQAIALLLQQIGKTTNSYALRAVAEGLKALPVKLTDAQAQQVTALLLRQISQTNDSFELRPLAEGLKALGPKLTDAQAQPAIAPLLQRFGKTTDLYALRAVVIGLEVLPVKLTDPQAQQAIALLLQQISQTNDYFELENLGDGLAALAAKMTETQAREVIAPLLQQIGKTTNPYALRALAKGLRALGPKLPDVQAQQPIAPLLQQILTTGPYAFEDLAEGLEALGPKLTDPQAQQAIETLLQRIGKTTDPHLLRAVAGGLKGLRPKLTDPQAQQAIGLLLRQIGKTTDSDAIPLAEVLKALASKLTDAQAQQAIDPLLQQISQTTNHFELRALAEGLRALASKLTDVQAQQASEPLLKQIANTTNTEALRALVEGLGALAPKLTDVQAQQTSEPLLKQVGNTANRYVLGPLAEVLGALPVKLTDAQAQQAIAPLLQQIAETTGSDALRALAEGLKALAPKLSDAQAQRSIALLLQGLEAAAPKLTAQARQAILPINLTADSDALQALDEGLNVLMAKLTDAQAQQAIEPLLQQIGKTTNPYALRVLAKGLPALGPKLTEAQAQQALIVVMSSLGWAATEEEAVDWAHALVALLPRATGQTGTRDLVAAIVYPFAAGPATEVLLDAIRARHSDAPAKEAGTATSLAWIAEKYPDQVHRPICPTPPQPNSLSGLNCPFAELEAPSYSAANSPKDTKDTTERRK